LAGFRSFALEGVTAPRTFVQRHLAFKVLRREKTTRRSVKGKRMRAAWDQDYLLQVLAGKMCLLRFFTSLSPCDPPRQTIWKSVLFVV